MNAYRVEDDLQHEINERITLAAGRTIPDRLVVILLAGMNQALDGDMSEQGLPARKHEGLP